MEETQAMAEARHFHRCFAGGPAPEDLLRNYAEACRTLGIGPDPLASSLCAAGADLTAAEYALRRRRGPANGLTQRALVMLALSEARPEAADRFLLREPARALAWCELAAAPFRALSQALKGAFLLWRHAR